MRPVAQALGPFDPGAWCIPGGLKKVLCFLHGCLIVLLNGAWGVDSREHGWVGEMTSEEIQAALQGLGHFAYHWTANPVGQSSLYVMKMLLDSSFT